MSDYKLTPKQAVAVGRAPAFPSSPDLTSGITIRDYFAARAMQGLVAIPETPEQMLEMEDGVDMLARICYGLADAMLKERAK
jgi:hypothetical protein